ncbi:hypothetical protein [Polynucleobacter necessarius]|uniref:hypothetical protein n=1 Tax=Polynucleobacter necessarius TaxID=576610 RepID=UPI0013B05BFB|nr:hypothetical protein [Polynucleobacter necessarius]
MSRPSIWLAPSCGQKRFEVVDELQVVSIILKQHNKRLLFAIAASPFALGALAQSAVSNIEITATGSQETTQSILTPTKILQGDELLNKLGSTLGAISQ